MSQPLELPSKRPITLDDLNSIDWWDGYKKIEIVDGHWYFGGEPFYRSHGAISGWIQTRLMVAMGEHVKELELGRVYTGSVGYVLEGYRDNIQLMRRTDISFVLKDNITSNKWEPYYRAPDLAIEIVSDDLAGDMARRIKDYLSHGTQQVWQVYPDSNQIIVHLPDGTSKKYGVDGQIDGGELLSGFKLDLSKVFES
jgi:Uma2 family endonuclease